MLGAGVGVGFGILICWERDWRLALAFSTIRFTDDCLKGLVCCTDAEGAPDERLGV